jgi:hypothetical protein
MSDIDPVEYGKLISKVDGLEKKVDSMEADIKTLLELANKSKGGFWMGMAIASGIGGVVTYITGVFFHK